MLSDDALYEPVAADPDRFVATALTRGPWSARFQHGGPPCALLTRAFERLVGDGMRLARVNFEYLSPVPVGEVKVVARVEKSAGGVERLSAELIARDRAVLLASGWCVTSVPGGIPAAARDDLPPPAELPGPQTREWIPEIAALLRGFIGDCVEWRFVKGDFNLHGPAAAWARVVPCLVAGEPMSSAGRLVALADTCNGLSSVLPVSDWKFMNTDLTVRFVRPAIGEWICLDTRTAMAGGEGAHAFANMHDEVGGLVASSAQTLYVGARMTPLPLPADWRERYIGEALAR